jgi:Prenyltransferase and squalene oxidase repeat
MVRVELCSMENITEDIIRWLAEDDNPVVQSLAYKEFPEYVKGASANIEDVTVIKRILSANSDGLVGNTVKYDQWYSGAVWMFAELVAYGFLSNHPVVNKNIRFILDTLQMSSGGFTMNWAPPSEAAGWTGDILYYLLKSGYDGPEAARAADWLMSVQQSDGGWCYSPLSGLKNTLLFTLFGKSGKPVRKIRESSLIATVSCGRALALYAAQSGKGKESVARAAEFVLNRKRLMKRTQKGGELYLSNPHFHRFSFPVLCQQDIVSSLLFIAEAGMINDERASEPFNIVMRSRLEDGTFSCKSRTHGTLHAKYRIKKGVSDKWATLQAMRLMKYVSW